MGQTQPDGFRKDAARIALISRLTHRQFAFDLGIGMPTLNKPITAYRDTDVVWVEDQKLVRGHKRLWRECGIRKKQRLP